MRIKIAKPRAVFSEYTPGWNGYSWSAWIASPGIVGFDDFGRAGVIVAPESGELPVEVQRLVERSASVEEAVQVLAASGVPLRSGPDTLGVCPKNQPELVRWC